MGENADGLKTKDVSIMWKGKEAIATVRQLSFVERFEMLDACSNMSMQGRLVNAKPKMKTMVEFMMHRCIIKAPFDITPEVIAKLPPEVGGVLYNEIEALNSETEKNEEASSSPQQEKPKTQS